jgi:hypothetical protein
MLSDTSLQCHIAKVHEMGLGEKNKRIVVNNSPVSSAYCTVQDYSKETVMLKERFRKALTLLDTRIIHILHHSCLVKPVQTNVLPSVFNTTHTVHLHDGM